MGNYAGKPRGSMSVWWFDTSCFQHLQGVLGCATDERFVWSYSVVTTVGVGSDCEASLQRTLLLTHCGRVTQICVFNTVKLGTSASSP